MKVWQAQRLGVRHSELVVVVVCPDYDRKLWINLEWTAINELLGQRKDDEVVP